MDNQARIVVFGHLEGLNVTSMCGTNYDTYTYISDDFMLCSVIYNLNNNPTGS